MVSWIIVLYVLVRELSSAFIDFARTNLSSNLLYQYVVWATRVASRFSVTVMITCAWLVWCRTGVVSRLIGGQRVQHITFICCELNAGLETELRHCQCEVCVWHKGRSSAKRFAVGTIAMDALVLTHITIQMS